MSQPNLVPLKQWVCDSCGQIMEVDNGWFEWYEERSTGKVKGFRIVHNQNECFYNSSQLHNEGKAVRDMHLHSFLGTNGLVTLMEILERGNVEDVKEWTEVVRRLHVDYYEEARIYWSAAKADGFLDGSNGVSEFLPKNLKDLVEYYNR